MPRVRQPSFATGEITPALYARVDVEQYLSGVALAENMFVSIYGGLINRPGSRLIDESGLASRLLPFQLGEAEGYALEMADNNIRFYTRGGGLLVEPVSATINPFVASLPARWRNLSTGGASVTNIPQIRQLDQDLGTAGGNNTQGGGVAAAFDDLSDTISAFCANNPSYFGSAHKDWGSGTNRQVVGFRLQGSSDLGLTGRRQSVTVQLVASSNNFGTDYRVLGSWEVLDEPGVVIERTVNAATAPSVRYHAVTVVQGQTGGADIVSIAELVFFGLALDTPALSLNGAAGSECIAEQEVTTTQPNREHVLTWFMGSPGGINFRVGHASMTETIRPLEFFPSGWATAAFTPRVSPFFIRFDHADTMTRVFDGGTTFLGSGATAPVPFSIPQPYGNSDLPAISFTQDANRLIMAHRRFPVLELRRGDQARTWKLAYKEFAPETFAPGANVLTLTKQGSGSATATHTYAATYIGENGEESLPSGPVSIAGVSTLTNVDFIRIAITALPAGIAAVNIYKLFGGAYGLLGLAVGQFDDTGLVPKADNPPPEGRNPFPSPGLYPSCATYWEQRLALGGSDINPETVELSKPGASHNFGRSSPPRDDDAITFTPAGPSVRRVRHMIATSDLAMFTDASVVVARRGDNALTPALEGGVRQVLTRGIGQVRPLIIDNNLVFVGSDGRNVRLLDPDYQDAELSLQAEHLFRGRQVVDWAYQETPWSLLWLAMSDGDLVMLSLLPRQGVIGWARARTEGGQVKSLAVIREGGTDKLYMRCRRWLRGAWRNTVEILAERPLADVRDAFFVDCGLSLDVPLPIAALATIEEGTITVSGHGVSIGGEIDIDGTGIAEIDGRRFRVTAISGSTLQVDANWVGLGPWRGGGTARKVVSTVSGLAHLEGMAVNVLNNGNVEEGQVVSGGAITLQKPGSRVHVGLPLVSRGQTLDIAEPPEGFGRRKNVREVQVLTRDSRALEFGPDFVNMDKRPSRDGSAKWNDPIGFKTETQEITVQPIWGLGGRLCFRQRSPLPIEILSITPVFERSTG